MKIQSDTKSLVLLPSLFHAKPAEIDFFIRWSRDVGVTIPEVTGNVHGRVVTPTSVVTLKKNPVRHQIFDAVTKYIPGQNC
jgi:hypothetical protein